MCYALIIALVEINLCEQKPLFFGPVQQLPTTNSIFISILHVCLINGSINSELDETKVFCTRKNSELTDT